MICAAPLYGNIVADVKVALARDQVPQAIEIVRSYRASGGVTPEVVEALSWIARAEFIRKDVVKADQYAQESYKLAQSQLKTHPLAQSANLQTAFGAAIEVEANVMAMRGERTAAITYLRDQLKMFYATPLRTRIQKNLNLLSLEGKPAPALEHALIAKGKPALLFFWAHWCGDCKYEAAILARIRNEYSPKGLQFIAQTEKFGYIGNGDDAPPEVELRYIEQVRQQYYSGVVDAPALVSEENINKYGASTTPTLVLVDRAGIVRMYHPGAMSYEELRPRVDALFR